MKTKVHRSEIREIYEILQLTDNQPLSATAPAPSILSFVIGYRMAVRFKPKRRTMKAQSHDDEARIVLPIDTNRTTLDFFCSYKPILTHQNMALFSLDALAENYRILVIIYYINRLYVEGAECLARHKFQISRSAFCAITDAITELSWPKGRQTKRGGNTWLPTPVCIMFV